MELAFWWLPIAVIVVLIAVIAAGWWLGRRRTAGRAIANSWRVTELPGYRTALARSGLFIGVTAVVLALVLATGTVAAARWVYTRVETPEKYNRDIVLCLDVSGSMTEYDADVIDRYLEMLPGFEGERMSLVLWNSSAVPVFPLTDDYAFVEDQLKTVRDAMKSGTGSAVYTSGTLTRPGASLVGDGLASCVMQFPGAEPSSTEPPVDDGRSRSIILATDNVVNGAPTVSLEQAAAYARDNFITVFGLDANEYRDAFAAEYEGVMTEYEFPYFPLTAEDSVDEIVDTITSEQTSKIQGAPQLYVIDRPEFWLWGLLIGIPVFLVCARRLRI
ncbi:vWA domain-containing protein [Gulosibacter massiliensis]|uniref:vWA domain-containing protein n=1 Tax=Gulosibacter massiliensis TaxID=2479839 RepID=UPI000F62E389|nr:VWA domain-containing protein [Gulosibacter massiliensis]